MTKIFVRGLNHQISSSDLAALFNNYGDVQSAMVPLNKKGENMTYGFVDFADEEAASQAVADLHGREIGGCILSVFKESVKPKLNFSPKKMVMGVTKKLRLHKRPRIAKAARAI